MPMAVFNPEKYTVSINFRKPRAIVIDRAVRRRRCAAAADRMSASRRRRFCDVFTSCRTPAIC